jgi:phage baseplate assembly protein W
MALYSDFNISFEQDPFSRDIQVVEDEEAVKQSVKSLVLTTFYERPFQPSIGSIIYQLLFEPISDVTELLIARTINDVITQFEPRASVKFVDVYSDTDPNGVKLDGHTVVVDVGFYVYNRPNLVTTTIVLRRLR